MSLSIQILGSNSASFAHNRHHTSQLLKIQDQQFLIDCGEGTQLLLKKYDVKFSRIDHILISHLHGDHYYGLIGLLSTLHLYGRQKELTLIGPPGLAEILTIQLKYSETTLAYPIRFIEWTPGEHKLIYENYKITIHTVPLDHRIPCCGYFFKEKPKKRRINKHMLPEKLSPLQIIALKNGEDILDENGKVKYKNEDISLPPHRAFSYAYCSDTKYNPDMVPMIRKADILYHEATFGEDMKDRALRTFHSTAFEAADIAKQADVNQLIIGHFSTRYKELWPLLKEAKSKFMNTELAIEGHIFEVHA
ncbi:MAG: ribonuclease Z [Cyclobacteriaceae bacterium]|nr:ribonuclease Z [Cyclobacteriaceae bacterium HetDA_MAG_MS6]